MVRMYILDGTMMTDRETMHDQLYMRFAFPEYYGRNLDALWDCLTEKEPGVIVLQHAEKADKELLLKLIGLMTDLVRYDPAWELNISTGDPDCHAHGAAPEAGCDGNCAHCGEPCADAAAGDASETCSEAAPEAGKSETPCGITGEAEKVCEGDATEDAAQPDESNAEVGVKAFFERYFG